MISQFVDQKQIVYIVRYVFGLKWMKRRERLTYRFPFNPFSGQRTGRYGTAAAECFKFGIFNSSLIVDLKLW